MATDTTAAADAASGAGMPQLDITTYSNQIFWLIVTLVVIYFVLTRVALPRIAAVLAERQGTITNDIAAAEELKQKAVEAEAGAEANKIIDAAKAEMQIQLDEELAKADAEIAAQTAESEKAIAEIRAS